MKPSAAGATHTAIHWPDHSIGKRESRAIRDNHNALYNDYHELLAALEEIAAHPIEHDNGRGAALDMLAIAKAAIAKARP